MTKCLDSLYNPGDCPQAQQVRGHTDHTAGQQVRPPGTEAGART